MNRDSFWLVLLVCNVLVNSAATTQAQLTSVATTIPAESNYSPEIPQQALKLIEQDESTALFDRLPINLSELQQLETATTRLIPDYQAATVGIQVGQGQGSGVVISPQGHILTAAHVVGEVGDRVTVVFPDGSKHFARVAGVDPGADAAIVRTEGKGPYPYIPMAENQFAVPGRWVIAIGHPNGYSRDRLPVVRLGRVVHMASKTVQTDCSLVGGDSGGPLFDLQGRVVGIHSRIGANNSVNLHVPTQVYLDDWDKLNAGYKAELMAEAEKEKPRRKAYLGISGRDAASSRGCMITEVSPTGPARAGGLQRGDLLVNADGESIQKFSDLVDVLKTKQPDDEIEFTVIRGGKRETFTVTLGGTEI